jgi:hypothetical protein
MKHMKIGDPNLLKSMAFMSGVLEDKLDELCDRLCEMQKDLEVTKEVIVAVSKTIDAIVKLEASKNET